MKMHGPKTKIILPQQAKMINIYKTTKVPQWLVTLKDFELPDDGFD